MNAPARHEHPRWATPDGYQVEVWPAYPAERCVVMVTGPGLYQSHIGLPSVTSALSWASNVIAEARRSRPRPAAKPETEAQRAERSGREAVAAAVSAGRGQARPIPWAHLAAQLGLAEADLRARFEPGERRP